MARADAIGIVCADLAASLDFYRRIGLPIPEEPQPDGHVEAQLPGGFRVMFDSVDVLKSFDPEWEQRSGRGRISIAFACDSPADVDATYAEVVGAGYRGFREPWDAFWGQRYALLLDPDGNVVDLFAPLGS